MGFTKKIKAELTADRYLPYIRHSDEHTIITRGRGAFQMLKLDGVSFETADRQRINTLHNSLNHALRNIADDNVMLYVHVIRTADDDYPDGGFSSETSKWIDASYRETLERKTLFRNDIYLTVYMQPRELPGAKLAKGVRRARTSQIEVDKDLLGELDDKTLQLLSNLSRFKPRRLAVERNSRGLLISQPASVLRQLITGHNEPVPVVMGTIGNAIYTDRVIFGREAFEIRHPAASTYGAMFGVKEYHAVTRPNMFDNLLTAPFQYVLTQSFRCVAKHEALRAMSLKEGRMRNSKDPALSQADQLVSARDELMSGHFVMGEHNLSLAVFASDARTLKNHVADAKNLLAESGAVSGREDLGLESAFWSQLPGNHPFRIRPALVTSRNFTAMAPLHNFPAGHRSGNEWGSAIAKLRSTAGTPFYFNFHVEDLGHALICGPSGSGKTVFQTFMLSQLGKFGAKGILFDKDYGCEIFVRALGGSYLGFQPGQPTGCAPFMAIDATPETAPFLVSLVKSMLSGGDDSCRFSAEDQKRIETAVASLATLPRGQRSVSTLKELLGFGRGAGDIGNRLDRWCETGQFGWIFDNQADSIDFGASLAGFDITAFLDDPEIRNPIMMYLMYRVEQLINGQRIAIFIDEFWKALSDPYFVSFVRDKLKVIRKQNGIIVAGTQSPSDVLASPIARTVIEQCANLIFFGSDKASRADLIDGFGLSEREFDIIRNELPRGHFLVKQGGNSVVCDLDLTGLDDVLTVLSGRTATNEIMRELRADNPDPAHWLPLLFQRRKEMK